jgi:hypothetical protein
LLATVGNPNVVEVKFWADLKAKHTPKRVLKYISDLELEMKDYLASRPKCAA